VQPEFNGFPFDRNFESWKPISTTDRGDNNTFRFVLGNDVAVKAGISGNISPWPDGTRFAKVAWLQEPGPDGLLHPGKFWQVEFMEKDAKRYKDTEGWGWGRWRGLELKPYGNDEHFVNECTGCHQPVRGNDYVYTLRLHQQFPATMRLSIIGLPHCLRVFRFSRSVGARSPCMLTQRATQRRRSTATKQPCRPCMLAALQSANRSLRRILLKRCLRWLHGRSATTRTGLEHAFPTSCWPLSLCKWRRQDGASLYRRFAGPEFIEDLPAAGIVAQRTSFIQSLAPAELP